MFRTLLAATTALTLMTGIAVAQSNTMSTTTTETTVAPAAASSYGNMQSNGNTPDPGNCGTPYDPKPCPPMPLRALDHYPG